MAYSQVDSLIKESDCDNDSVFHDVPQDEDIKQLRLGYQSGLLIENLQQYSFNYLASDFLIDALKFLQGFKRNYFIPRNDEILPDNKAVLTIRLMSFRAHNLLMI